MKFLIVVLALAALSQAEPEADAGYFYRNHYSPYYYPYSSYGRFYGYPSHYGYGYHGLHKREAEADAQVLLNTPALPFLPYSNVYNPYVAAPYVSPVATVAPYASPVATVAPYVAPYVAPVAPAVLPRRPYSPRDCVTAGGCAALTLKEHGLAKREAEAEAEADADAEADAYYYNSFPYTYGLYSGYNGFNPYYANYAYAPYFGYNYAPAVYNAAPVVTNPAPVVYNAAPVVAKPAPVVADPAPVVYNTAPVVAPAPAPIVYKSAPVVAPLPVVRKPVVTPVVKEVVKPVTYTHLGAHPVSPTTVLEKKTHVVGHQVHY